MPFRLELSPRAKTRGWKVKIRDKERLESPHVTIQFRWRTWRVDLRTGEMMDHGNSWGQIDPDVAETVVSSWEAICRAWDEMYPLNPVGTDDEK